MPLGVGQGQNVGLRDILPYYDFVPPGASVFHKHMSSFCKFSYIFKFQQAKSIHKLITDSFQIGLASWNRKIQRKLAQKLYVRLLLLWWRQDNRKTIVKCAWSLIGCWLRYSVVLNEYVWCTLLQHKFRWMQNAVRCSWRTQGLILHICLWRVMHAVWTLFWSYCKNSASVI